MCVNVCENVSASNVDLCSPNLNAPLVLNCSGVSCSLLPPSVSCLQAHGQFHLCCLHCLLTKSSCETALSISLCVCVCTWEEVSAAHEDLPVDESEGVHVHLLERRLTVPQVHRPLQDLRSHVADGTHLKTHTHTHTA